MDKNKSSKESKQSLPHVRRLKNLKRQSDVKETRNSRPRKDEIVLESVLGFTVSNTSCLQISKTGKITKKTFSITSTLTLQTGFFCACFMKYFFLSSLCCQVGWRILQAVLSSYSTWTPETRDTSSTRRGRPWPACPGPATLSTWWRESLVTGHVSGSGQCQHCLWSQHCRVTSLVWVVSASLEMMIMWWQLEPSTTWPSMCGTGGTTRRSRPTRYHFMSSPSASLTMEHASLLLEIGNYNYYFVKNMILDWHG